jgi:hypothetical protein
MALIIAVAGYLGAWLLVAGPVYQAAVELDAEAFDRETIARANDAVPPPPPISPWWWLLPPVAWLRQRRVERAHREAVLKVMTPEQVTHLLRFGAKATGWLIVAVGAALIGVKESWELVELLDWPGGVLAALVVVPLVLALLHAGLRVRRDHRMKAVQSSLRDPAPDAPAA